MATADNPNDYWHCPQCCCTFYITAQEYDPCPDGLCKGNLIPDARWQPASSVRPEPRPVRGVATSD